MFFYLFIYLYTGFSTIFSTTFSVSITLGGLLCSITSKILNTQAIKTDKKNEIKRNRERSEKAKAEQKAYFDKLEEIKKEPPFYTLFTKEEAQKYIDKVKAIDSINFQESSIIKFLINKFEFIL